MEEYKNESHQYPEFQSTEHAESPTPEKPKHYPVSPTLYQLRKYFVYVLVGGLIISALIAIIAILVGTMDGLIGKSIATVGVIIVHSLIALAFISTTNEERPKKGSSMVINTLFALTVLSLITAMLGVWDIITDNNIIMRQYLVYLAATIASVILYGLFQAIEDDRSTVISRNTAIGATLLSFILLIPVIHQFDLPDFYYRFLTATNVVVGVSIVITVIFHWYYISRHPKVGQSAMGQQQAASTIHPVLRAFLIIFAILFGLPFVFGILRFFVDLASGQ